MDGHGFTDADMTMARRKIYLLNLDWTEKFLSELYDEDPFMTIWQARHRARVRMVEGLIEIQGATPELVEQLRILKAAEKNT